VSPSRSTEHRETHVSLPRNTEHVSHPQVTLAMALFRVSGSHVCLYVCAGVTEIWKNLEKI